MQVISDGIDIAYILQKTISNGYCFISDGITLETNAALLHEVLSNKLVEPEKPIEYIGQGDFKVQQHHARLYGLLDDERMPVASEVCRGFAHEFGSFPVLCSWLMNEIGYQHYRSSSDWISPHRDRKSDHLLSATITIQGEALIRIYRFNSDPPTYKDIVQIDEVLTRPRMLMLLRAHGLGSGEQIIHEVLPPRTSDRFIVNMRMRNTLLPVPYRSWESPT